MEPRLPIDARAGALMTLLCLLWGAQEVALKGFGGGMSPLLQLGLRSGLAALLVVPMLGWRTRTLGLRHWRAGLCAGLLFGVKFLFLGQALRMTSASHAVLFLYTAPLFVALTLHAWLPAERLSRRQWAGVVAAFGGVSLALLGGNAADPVSSLRGDALALASGICWGATTVCIRLSSLAQAPPGVTLLWQLIGGFALLVPASVLLGQASVEAGPQTWLSLGFQAVVLSFATYLAWFWLLRHYLASPLGMLGLMTPMIGMAFGSLMLHEPLSASFLIGAALLLAGLLAVTLLRPPALRCA